MAAQTVFGELHRAERLVNNLSARVKGMEMGGPISAADPVDTLRDNEGTWPFFSTMLDQLQKNLRKHPRTVSLKIFGMTQRALNPPVRVLLGGSHLCTSTVIYRA